MDIAELHRKAHSDPETLSKKEWQQIHKDAFSVPEKDFPDDDINTAKVSSSGQSKKKEGWW